MAITPETLLNFIPRQFGVEARELQADTLLFSSGLLDSFCMVSLMDFIEQEAGFRIRSTEVTLDNLDSVERILGFVRRRTGG